MSTPGVSPPFMLGTSSSFVQGGQGTPNDTLSLMNSIRTQDMAVTQQRWLRASRSMAFYAGSPSGSRYSNQAGPGFGRSDLGYSFNEINAKMNSIIGRQIQHRKSLSCQSALSQYNNVANKFSKIFSYCENKMSLPEKRSKGFEKGVGSGLAIAELYLNRKHDLLNGDVDVRLWEFNSFIFDYTARDIWDFTDCKYFWGQYYSDKAAVIASYPEAEEKIRSMGTAAYGNNTFQFLPEAVVSRQKNSLLVSRFWQQVGVEKTVWVSMKTGETIHNIPKNIQRPPYMKEVKIPSIAWKLSIVVNEMIISEVIDPYGLGEEAPLLAYTWDYDPEIQQPEFRVRGFPDTLIDAQWLLNRTIVKNHNMIESSVNTGWKIEEGSLVDEDIALRGSEGLNFVYKIGSTPPDKILPTALPESNFMLINQLRESIEISSAVKRPLDGPDNESNSGIMSMIRQDAADVPLQKYWDSLDRTTKREAKLIMMMTSKNWTEHKFSQILGVPVEECLDLMNVEIQEFSMVVAEGIYTDVQKRADFINLTEVAAIIGIKPSARLLLSKAPITCTDELLADMEQQEAAAREGQEQKSALELALVQAEIKKINAQALEQLNMAGSHHARAGSYAGLENERNAEVAKNESVSNKNNVESLLKLLPLIEQYGIDKVNQLVLSLNQDQLLKPHEEADGQIETFIPEPAMGSEGSSPPVDLQAQNGDPESDGNASTLS